MKLYLTKTPRILQKIFKKYTWCFFSDKKEIYLTFDDGPTPEITNWTLDLLKKYNAKATFFCIGKNIVNHPEIYQQILDENHTIGNHTQNHFNGWKHSTEEYVDNIISCENIISSVEEKSANSKTLNSKLFRPPYGKIKKSQAKEILKKGYKIIFWDVLSADFDTTISNQKCLENVLKNTTNGSVVVFHDSVKAAKKLKFVLPKVLDYYSKKGFLFKAID